MTLTQRILRALPATYPELVALLRAKRRSVNAALYELKALGRVHRTERKGTRMSRRQRGQAPCIWVRGAAR